MTKTKITVTCLNGYTFSLTLINTSVDNIKKRIYEHFKKVEPRQPARVWYHSPTRTTVRKQALYKYSPMFQKLLLGNDILKDDANLNSGDTLTLVIDNELYRIAIAAKENYEDSMRYVGWR